MRILLDLDNCGADFLKPLLQAVNATRPVGSHATPRDVIDWEMKVGFTPDEQKLLAAWRQPGFFRALEPMAGFVQAVSDLKDMGHHVFIGTAAKSPHALSEKAEWIAEHLGHIINPVADVFYADRKYCIPTDVMVDDSPNQITPYRDANPQALILAPDYTFNKVCERSCARIPDCNNMETFWKKITEIVLTVTKARYRG